MTTAAPVTAAARAHNAAGGPPTAAAAVRGIGLTKRFDDGTVALDGVSLDCHPGECVVLVGPSGCGKTTLLRIVAGLETPTSGRIIFDDRDVTALPAQSRDVAMVFQNYSLYPDKTVAKNIEFPLRMAKVSVDERRRRVGAAARLLRIEELLDRRPAELSGGQKQRVGIGRAIVRSSRVLLMDEPLSNLDAELRVEMRAELKQLTRALGTTLLYVTHDQVEALTLADRLVVMRRGLIEQQGSPTRVFEHPLTPFVARFLGGMNLLTGIALDGALELGAGGRLRLPETSNGVGSEVVVGVRPDQVALDETPGRRDGQLGLHGEIILVELTGTSRVVHVAVTDQQTVKVSVPANQELPQDRVRLRIEPDALHVYPKEHVE